MKAGDPLAQIDPRPYQAALEQAKGNLRRDQALLADAKLDLKRYEELIKEDSVAQQQLDTQRALVDQYVGTLESDEARSRPRRSISLLHIISPGHRPRRSAPGRPGQLCHSRRYQRLVVITELQPITAIFADPGGQCERPHAALQPAPP